MEVQSLHVVQTNPYITLGLCTARLVLARSPYRRLRPVRWGQRIWRETCSAGADGLREVVCNEQRMKRQAITCGRVTTYHRFSRDSAQVLSAPMHCDVWPLTLLQKMERSQHAVRHVQPSTTPGLGQHLDDAPGV